MNGTTKYTIDMTAADPRGDGEIWVRGPELLVRGTPRRRRRTWCVRLGVVRGTALGGCCMFGTEAEALECFNRRTDPERGYRCPGCGEYDAPNRHELCADCVAERPDEDDHNGDVGLETGDFC